MEPNENNNFNPESVMEPNSYSTFYKELEDTVSKYKTP